MRALATHLVIVWLSMLGASALTLKFKVKEQRADGGGSVAGALVECRVLQTTWFESSENVLRGTSNARGVVRFRNVVIPDVWEYDTYVNCQATHEHYYDQPYFDRVDVFSERGVVLDSVRHALRVGNKRPPLSNVSIKVVIRESVAGGARIANVTVDCSWDGYSHECGSAVTNENGVAMLENVPVDERLFLYASAAVQDAHRYSTASCTLRVSANDTVVKQSLRLPVVSTPADGQQWTQVAGGAETRWASGGSPGACSTDSARIVFAHRTGDVYDSTAGVRVLRFDPASLRWSPLGDEIAIPSLVEMGVVDDDVVIDRQDSVGSITLHLSHDGSRLAVAAPHLSLREGSAQESTFINFVVVLELQEATGRWQLVGEPLSPYFNNFECVFVQLSSDGSRLALAGKSKACPDCPANVTKLSVREFDPAQNSWIPVGNDDVAIEASVHFSAFSLSSNGDRLAVADASDNDPIPWSGSVRVFSFDDALSQWVSWGQTIFGIFRSGMLGSSLSLSANGTRLAVHQSSDRSRGIVNTYDFDATDLKWKPVGQALRGAAPDDLLGTRLHLSADGTRLAAVSDGAFNRNAEDRVGYATVFQLSPDSLRWSPVGSGFAGQVLENHYVHLDAITLSADGTQAVVTAERYNRTEHSQFSIVRLFEQPARFT